MFYRPQFCCHCGEKIARAKWTPLTSRRFCEFCEIEQKQHDLIPRAAMCIAILIGAAGVTAYVTGGGTAPSNSNRQVVSRPGPRANSIDAEKNLSIRNSAPPAANLPSANIKQREVDKNSSTEPVYFCGALTKKGTPCTRRVKTKGRCWQHKGQPAAEDARD